MPRSPSQKHKRFFSSLLVSMFLFMAIPLNVFAYEAAFVAVTVDTANKLYVGNIVIADERKPANHPENVFLGRSDLPLTFPFEGRSDLNRIDHTGAQLVNSILVASMNAALYHLNGGRAFSSLDEMRRVSTALVGKNGINGYSISSGKSGPVYIDFEFDVFRIGTPERLSSSDYITISKNGRSVSYIFQLPKYTSKENDPTKYISMRLLHDTAWQFFDMNITSMDVAEEIQKPGIVMRMLASLLGNTVRGLESLLGLSPIHDLVFNQGIRGMGLYVFGTFPASWMEPIGLLFIVFQAIAWATILFSILNLVFRSNLATMSSSMRVDVMLNIKRFIFSGLLLVFLFPALNVIFRLSFMLTEVFSSMVPPQAKSAFFVSIPMQGNTLAAIIAYIAYFVASLNFNIIYIIRGIVLAILVATSPLFVVLMTTSEANKSVTLEWMKTLLANLLLQPIHALVLAFMMSIPFSGIRGIEAIVYIFALAPISETIRSIIFSQAGSDNTNTARGVQRFAGKSAASIFFAGKLAYRQAKEYGQSRGVDKRGGDKRGGDNRGDDNKGG